MMKSIFLEELEKLQKEQKNGKFDNIADLFSAVLDDYLYIYYLELDDLELDNDFSDLDLDDFLKLD